MIGLGGFKTALILQSIMAILT